MTASQADFADLVRRASLKSLRALKLSAEVTDADALLAKNVEAEIRESHQWSLSEDRTELRVQLGFDVALSPTEAETRARFKASATYELIYAFDEPLPSDPKVEEALDLFAARNPRFNAWPFLREYVNYAATYAGLPAILLPLLKPYATAPRDTRVE